jgi:hypothetical protein
MYVYRLVPSTEFGVLTLHKWSTLCLYYSLGAFSYALGKEPSQQAQALAAFLFRRTTMSEYCRETRTTTQPPSVQGEHRCL